MLERHELVGKQFSFGNRKKKKRKKEQQFTKCSRNPKLSCPGSAPEQCHDDYKMLILTSLK